MESRRLLSTFYANRPSTGTAIAEAVDGRMSLPLNAPMLSSIHRCLVRHELITPQARRSTAGRLQALGT